MGYGTDGLTFNTLRQGNIERLPQFKNAQGEPAHSKPDGSDWSNAEWLQAVVGELGEFANLAKKVRRGDVPDDPDAQRRMQEALADELADVAIYLDILAYRTGVNLGEAIMNKWNRTSRKVGCKLFIDAEGVHCHESFKPVNDGPLDEFKDAMPLG